MCIPRCWWCSRQAGTVTSFAPCTAAHGKMSLTMQLGVAGAAAAQRAVADRAAAVLGGGPPGQPRRRGRGQGEAACMHQALLRAGLQRAALLQAAAAPLVLGAPLPAPGALAQPPQRRGVLWPCTSGPGGPGLTHVRWACSGAPVLRGRALGVADQPARALRADRHTRAGHAGARVLHP